MAAMTAPDQAARRQRFEAVYSVGRDPVVRYIARRSEPDAIEDLFANAMLVAWQRVDEVPDGAEVPWLLGVARRVLANHRRARGRFGNLVRRLGSRGATGDAGDPTLVGRMAGVVVDPDLVAALASLSADDAEILRLSAWDELEPREIATVLGITANAAAVRLHRARTRLRAALGKDPALTGHEAGVKRKEATL
jgi:RNA polymerase sigma-70 factor (ECF subfamily)